MNPNNPFLISGYYRPDYFCDCEKETQTIAEALSGDFIARHRLKAANSVNSALRKLMDSELVYRTADGYIVYDRFISEWLRNRGISPSHTHSRKML